jgi:hypothetical protein
MKKIECPGCGKTNTSSAGTNARIRHCNECGLTFNSCTRCYGQGTDQCHRCEVVVKGA